MLISSKCALKKRKCFVHVEMRLLRQLLTAVLVVHTPICRHSTGKAKMREELMKKFAEDDRLEQLNEHKRRLKVGSGDFGSLHLIEHWHFEFVALCWLNWCGIVPWYCPVVFMQLCSKCF